MHLQGETSMCRFAIEMLGEAEKLNLLPSKRINCAHHLDEGAPKTIEFPNYKNIIRSEVGESGFV
ncbi:hypothetical protein X759_32250 [Mesorhizobium sp. LSHC420B00]|nr:hypothetical protein X759_32250 [Mesorhizobium sp. LSHC420B00]